MKAITTPTLESRLAQREQPNQRHLMYQRWSHLLFAHWPADPARIQASLPDGLFVDTYECEAFLGAVPFFMERIRPRFLPPVPGLSWFLEFNLRTYVHDAWGRPGVWFYSLDASQPLAVAIARRFFHLPYFRAEMRAPIENRRVQYASHRRGHKLPDEMKYEIPTDQTRVAEPGSREFFLLERYLLFAHDSGRFQLRSGRVHHSPYPFGEVDPGTFEANVEAAFSAAGFDPPDGSPCDLHYSPGVNVRVFPTIRV